MGRSPRAVARRLVRATFRAFSPNWVERYNRGDMAGKDRQGGEPVREAQELLLAIWKRRTELVEQGKQPEGVVLSRAQYELLQSYNARLGELPNQQLDYIEKYRVFDLPIYVDNDSAMRVMEGQ
jgi:hypothetical protein